MPAGSSSQLPAAEPSQQRFDAALTEHV